MKVGEKFKADKEKRRYTVQAANARFVIMTKPFAAQRTYLYTVADLERGVRGAVGLIFGPPQDVDTPEGAAAVLEEMQRGDFGVSYRNCVNLSDAERAQLIQ